jgi:stress-induced morphogen
MKIFCLNKINLLRKTNYQGFKNIIFPSFIRSTFVEKSLIEDKLNKNLKIESLEVTDISGSCGTSFMIKIKSSDLKGKTVINQHRRINEILKDELKELHALQLKVES